MCGWGMRQGSASTVVHASGRQLVLSCAVSLSKEETPVMTQEKLCSTLYLVVIPRAFSAHVSDQVM